MTATVEWKCPKCGALPNEHGRGGDDKCVNRHRDGDCMGFLCECSYEGDDSAHGTTFDNPCPEANCYHCGFGGVFPQKPKGLQAWERKALDAGWSPPAHRAEELGLKVSP